MIEYDRLGSRIDDYHPGYIALIKKGLFSDLIHPGDWWCYTEVEVTEFEDKPPEFGILEVTYEQDGEQLDFA
jgi:hypothetical protein